MESLQVGERVVGDAGDLVGLKKPEHKLISQENPKKTSKHLQRGHVPEARKHLRSHQSQFVIAEQQVLQTGGALQCSILDIHDFIVAKVPAGNEQA